MALHSSLTGAELHENKGAASASNDTVATVTGGATVWKKLTTANLDSTSVIKLNTRYLTGVITDVSTAGSFLILPVPDSCTISAIEFVLEKAITVADASVQVINPGIGTVSTTTIAFAGSAEGTTFNASGLLNTSITGPKYIKVNSLGGSTTACKLYVNVKVTLV